MSVAGAEGDAQRRVEKLEALLARIQKNRRPLPAPASRAAAPAASAPRRKRNQYATLPGVPPTAASAPPDATSPVAEPPAPPEPTSPVEAMPQAAPPAAEPPKAAPAPTPLQVAVAGEVKGREAEPSATAGGSGPSAADHPSAGRKPAGPKAGEPKTTGPKIAEPAAAEPTSTEPKAADAAAPRQPAPAGRDEVAATTPLRIDPTPPPAAEVAKLVEPAAPEEEPSFGQLLARTLSLRPR